MEYALTASLILSPTVLPLLIVSVFLVIWFGTRRPPGIPPGPPLTPILGNLMDIHGNDPQPLYKTLRDKFGNIFSLYVANQLVVVLNGYDLIKTAFVKKADAFSDRPPGHRVIEGQSRGIVTTSGSLWKQHRKFALITLRSFGFGKFSLEKNIQDEISIFLDAIGEEGKMNFDPRQIVHTSVSNVICSIVFGKRFQYNDPEFIAFMEISEAVLQKRSLPFVSFLKFLKYLPGDVMGVNVEERANKKYVAFVTKMYNEHMETFDENNIRDYIDAFILEMKSATENSQLGITFTSCQLIGEIIDLFQAATDTTSTIIRWALLYLIQHPEIQDRMRAEIKQIVGKDNTPSLTDRPDLQYCEATIMEVLRIASIAPIALPHYTSQDTSLDGFHIPKSTIVIANIDSVLNDPVLWNEPHKFHPERFLKADGSLEKPDEFIPFSIGRRVCLGESLARMELFLFLTSMVQRFVFLMPDDEELPEMDGVTGITHSPHPFKIRVHKL
ncbi:hypothetical protein ScPMuIL_016627 [Solemya velum]